MNVAASSDVSAMINSNAINYQPPVTLQQYLDTVLDLSKRMLIEQLFQAAHQVIALTMKRNGIVEDMPLVRIKSDDHIDADGISGLIRVSTGLIDHCLDLAAPSVRRFLPSTTPPSEIPGITGTSNIFQLGCCS